MREIRTHGSEGGEAGQPAFPTPIKPSTFAIGYSPFAIRPAIAGGPVCGARHI